jgi:nucleotide-binding universal stress UspA family protein
MGTPFDAAGDRTPPERERRALPREKCAGAPAVGASKSAIRGAARAGTDIAFEGCMSSHPPSAFVVVAAVEDSLLGDRVAHVAGNHAALVAGELHLVHVVPLAPGIGQPHVPVERAAQETRAALEHGRDLMDRFVRDAAAQHAALSGITGHVLAGQVDAEILRAAAHVSADLIAVGTHGRRGVSRLMLGSVAETIVRKASCPVLVVRPKEWSRRDYPWIEPPCPDCVAAQQASAGARRWCDRHSQHHPHARLHYELPASFGEGSMLLRP